MLEVRDSDHSGEANGYFGLGPLHTVAFKRRVAEERSVPALCEDLSHGWGQRRRDLTKPVDNHDMVKVEGKDAAHEGGARDLSMWTLRDAEDIAGASERRNEEDEWYRHNKGTGCPLPRPWRAPARRALSWRKWVHSVIEVRHGRRWMSVPYRRPSAAPRGRIGARSSKGCMPAFGLQSPLPLLNSERGGEQGS